MLGKKVKSPLQIIAYLSITFLDINFLDTAHSADSERLNIKHARSMSEPFIKPGRPGALLPKTLSHSSPGTTDGGKAKSAAMSIPMPKKPNKQRSNDLNVGECRQSNNFFYGDYPQFIDLSPMSIQELEKYKSDILRYEQPPSHIYIPPCPYIPPQNSSYSIEKDTHYNQNHLFY